MKIKNGYLLNKEERFKILASIKKHLQEEGVNINRTINNLEAEWSLHNYLYNIGAFVESTKDVDLEFKEDPRWYVRTGTIIIQILGI